MTAGYMGFVDSERVGRQLRDGVSVLLGVRETVWGDVVIGVESRVEFSTIWVGGACEDAADAILWYDLYE